MAILDFELEMKDLGISEQSPCWFLGDNFFVLGKAGVGGIRLQPNASQKERVLPFREVRL